MMDRMICWISLLTVSFMIMRDVQAAKKSIVFSLIFICSSFRLSAKRGKFIYDNQR